MTTPQLLLRASPLQIERHEFLDIEVHATDSADTHSSLPLEISRTYARHDTDPLRWRVELSLRFGGDVDGKPSVYSGVLRIAGYFLIHKKYPAEKIRSLIEVTASSILYGACREMLANLTARGSHGVVSLPSISFVPPKKPETARLAEAGPAYKTHPRVKAPSTSKRR
jgi:preprotein translocase subunit SecB